MMRQCMIRVLWCVVLLGLLGAAAVVDGEGATDIAATIEQLRSALRALPAAEGPHQAQAVSTVVEQVVLPHVDVNLAGKLVMGRYWRDANPTQRQAFVDTYRTMLLRVYAVHALDYLDASVDYLSAQMTADGQRQRVATRVRRAGQPDMTVDYQMRKSDAGWRVFDVVVNGVSVVITLRNAVGEDFARHGIDGVIERLRAKLASGGAQGE